MKIANMCLVLLFFLLCYSTNKCNCEPVANFSFLSKLFFSLKNFSTAKKMRKKKLGRFQRVEESDSNNNDCDSNIYVLIHCMKVIWD